MKKWIFIIFMVFISHITFGQEVNRDGRQISASGSGVSRRIVAEIFIEDGINVNLEFRNGSTFLVIIVTRDHFTEIDNFEMFIKADRLITRFRETFDSITDSAGRNDFIDRAITYRSSRYRFSRDFIDGDYVSRFEITLPNYQFDVVLYAQEFNVSFLVSGQQYTFSADPVEIRATQDAGLLMTVAGLR